MSAERVPSTPAVLALRAAKVEFTPHFYTYEEKGGTAVSSRELGVDEHAVVKTLVMADDKAAPLIVLMHGDRKVSTKALARIIGVKSVEPCTPEWAEPITGIPAATIRRLAKEFGATKPAALPTAKTLPTHWWA